MGPLFQAAELNLQVNMNPSEVTDLMRNMKAQSRKVRHACIYQTSHIIMIMIIIIINMLIACSYQTAQVCTRSTHTNAHVYSLASCTICYNISGMLLEWSSSGRFTSLWAYGVYRFYT
jgi:hypothetical protein